MQRHPAQAVTDEPTPSHWPQHVRPISLDGLRFLGVGDDGLIYWDGKAIEMRRALTRWQRVGAVLVTLSAIVGAGAAVASAYADIAALSG